MRGDSGNDVVLGDLGHDELGGGEGDDYLGGSAGDDGHSGGAGDDRMLDGAGDDGYAGDDGRGRGQLRANDRSGSRRPASRHGDQRRLQRDDLLVVEVVIATTFSTSHRRLGRQQTGRPRRLDRLLGGDGQDLIEGGSGNDAMNGGAGSTRPRTWKAESVTVDLLAGGEGSGSDTLVAIENVIGSAFSDYLRGDSLPNLLEAFGSDDILEGRGGTTRWTEAKALTQVTEATAATTASRWSSEPPASREVRHGPEPLEIEERKELIMSRSTLVLALVALVFAGTAHAQTDEGLASSIEYTTRFVHPGPTGQNDLTIENYIIAQINAAPAGSQIAFAVRDWIRPQVATAVTNAHNRGVDVIGVIDELRPIGLPFLQAMVAALGGRVIFCGSPTFQFLSCISDVLTPGLMHNKFWTFLGACRRVENVVIQTSQNFTGPQMHQFQDLVRIDEDRQLYEGYRTFVEDMKAQERTSDYFTDHVTSGDDGRNTLYPFPLPARPADQRHDRRPPEGSRLFRGRLPGRSRAHPVAQLGFRTERMVIVDELVKLEREGCLVEVINSNSDPDVVAELVNQGVTYIPLYHGATDLATHTKLWFVDAKSTSQMRGRRSSTRVVRTGARISTRRTTPCSASSMTASTPTTTRTGSR